MPKHMLMDPAYPDLVADWAMSDEDESKTAGCANDNGGERGNDSTDPLLTMLGRLEVAATRLW